MFTSLVHVLEYFQINGDLLTKLLIPTQRKFPSQEATESESESVGFTSPERQRR